MWDCIFADIKYCPDRYRVLCAAFLKDSPNTQSPVLHDTEGLLFLCFLIKAHYRELQQPFVCQCKCYAESSPGTARQ